MEVTEVVDKSRWPENVPRNPTELEAQWGHEVDKWAGKYNKVYANKEDILQEIRKTIHKPDFCLRYVQALERCPTLPDTMTTQEALNYLGIIYQAWHSRQYRFEKRKIPWMPDPVNASDGIGRHSLKALWKTDDIVKLVGDSVFRQSRPTALPRLKSTNANFAGYLRRAVHHAVCNYIRTKSRREKERPFDHFWVFRNKVAHMDEPTPFEELLVHEHHGNDPDVRAELMMAVSKIEAAVPDHKDVLMSLLKDGHSLSEAINKLDVTKRENISVRRVLGKALEIDLLGVAV